MKIKMMMLGVAAFLLAGGTVVSAQEAEGVLKSGEEKAAETAAAQEPAAASHVKVGNKICPVSGESVDKMEGAQYEYKGKIYNLCCPMCVKDFTKDPEKYSRIAEESVAAESQAAVSDVPAEEPVEAVHEHEHE